VAERWTVLSILRTTTEFLTERGVSEPRLSAEVLLADVLDCRRLDLYLSFDRPLETAELDAYRERVRRRMSGEPVQYITGMAGFRGLDLSVDRRVLIPRPETELLVGEVLTWARAEAARGHVPGGGWRIVDLGTGSGAIACALAVELEDLAWVVGTDASQEALAVARANARRVGAVRTRWLAADGLEAFTPRGGFDVVVSNPPYVRQAERGTLPPEVRDWEPPAALFAGPDGSEMLERIVDAAGRHLRQGGLLALEVGEGQAAAVRGRIEDAPHLQVLSTFRDHAGIERGVLALAADR